MLAEHPCPAPEVPGQGRETPGLVGSSHVVDGCSHPGLVGALCQGFHPSRQQCQGCRQLTRVPAAAQQGHTGRRALSPPGTAPGDPRQHSQNEVLEAADPGLLQGPSSGVSVGEAPWEAEPPSHALHSMVWGPLPAPTCLPGLTNTRGLLGSPPSLPQTAAVQESGRLGQGDHGPVEAS